MKIVFLCVANSARSQMAEGVARSILPTPVEVLSAGSQPTSVHPIAIQVMKEIGIDISHYISKSISQIVIDDADIVITLCAEQVCPRVPPTSRRVHWSLQDPVTQGASGEEQLLSFRETRDRLVELITNLSREYFPILG